MKRVLTYLLVTMTLLITSVANAGQINIDLFDDEQGPLIATVGQTVSSSVLGGMLGGERDIVINSFTGLFDNMETTANVQNGAFSFNSDSTVTSQFALQWDGIDGSGEINANGLADDLGVGVDLSNFKSFQTTTLFADFNYFFETTVWWANGTESETISLLGPGNSDYGSPKVGAFSFGLFEYADFTDVSALQVVGNSAAPCCYTDTDGRLIEVGSRVSSFDVTVSQVVAVPEPSSAGLIAMAGFMCFGAAAVSKRKNKNT